MIKILALLLLTLPVHAGVILKDTPSKNKRWVYDDGFIEIILTDKQVEWCNGKYYLYVLAGSQKIDGCWEEQDSLVHVKYDTGHRFVVKAHKFEETKMNDSPVIKTRNYRD